MPVSFGRLYTQIRESTKIGNVERPLEADEIRHLAQKAIDKCPLTNISEKFSESFLKFLNDIADRVQFFTEQFRDMDCMEASKNFEQLTQSQLNEFISLVWHTYERAQAVPGDACGAIAA